MADELKGGPLGAGIGLLAALAACGPALGMDVDQRDKAKRRIREGRFDDAMAIVERTLSRHPEDAEAHALGARILLERGVARDVEVSLVQWADAKPASAAPIEALRRFYREAKRGDDLAALTARASAVRGEGRVPLLRILVDDLAEAGRRGDLATPLGLLLGTSDAETIAWAVEATDAASRSQLPRMLRAFVSVPDTSPNAAVLDELGFLLSLRTARGVRAVPVAGKPGAIELPPSGGHDPTQVATAPVVVEKAGPVYPEIMRRARIEGLVRLRAIILASGRTIVTGTIESSNAVFLEPAVEAVARWRYEPGRLEGKPVAVDMDITVEFRLR